MRLRTALGFLPFLVGACSGDTDLKRVESRGAWALEPAAGPLVEAVSDGRTGSVWPSGESCAGLLRALDAMDAASVDRLDPAAAPVGLTVLAPRALVVRADLPIPQVDASALGAFPCAVAVGAAISLPTAPDRVLDRRTIHAAYPTGTHRRRNTEHQQLEKELAAARRGGRGDTDILRTGDPMLDLIGTVAGGIIGGIGAVSANRDARALEAALDATPAFVEEPSFAPYRYTLSEIEAERRFTLPLALHDRAAALSWRASVTLSEQRRFALATGRHADDTATPPVSGATLVTEAEFAAWRHAPPVLTAGVILTHLQAVVADADAATSATLAATLASLNAETPAALAVQGEAAEPSPAGNQSTPDLSAAVDALPEAREPAAGPRRSIGEAGARPSRTAGALDRGVLAVGVDRLAGFYVTEEHIVAPAAALGHSSLVVVHYPDGMRAHGLVEIVDAELGLALLYLPRPGSPLPRRQGAAPPQSAAGPSGMPWTIDGQVAGLFVDQPEHGARRWIDASTLDRFVARLEAL